MLLITIFQVLLAIVATCSLVAVLHYSFRDKILVHFVRVSEDSKLYWVLVWIGAFTFAYFGCKALLFWIPDWFSYWDHEYGGFRPYRDSLAGVVALGWSIWFMSLGGTQECCSCRDLADRAKGWTEQGSGFICQECLEIALCLLEEWRNREKE